MTPALQGYRVDAVDHKNRVQCSWHTLASYPTLEDAHAAAKTSARQCRGWPWKRVKIVEIEEDQTYIASNYARAKRRKKMSEYLFGCGPGHLGRRASRIARANGARVCNHTDPGCGCGYGCTDECPARQRHWFAGPNRGEPFDRALAAQVMAALTRAGLVVGGAA